MDGDAISPFVEGSRPKPNTCFVYILTSFATLGGLLFGYDIGIVSGSMLLIQPYFQLTTFWQELIVSGTIIAAVVFALVAGVMADLVGRKKTIMSASVVFVLGSVVMGVASSKEVLLTGRIVVGVGVGLASVAVPVYVAEAAPRHIRGRLVTLNQLFITIGILISSIIAGGFSELQETGWRYMLALAGVFAIFQFIGFFFLPESPRWLLSKGRGELARAVLTHIRGGEDISIELADIRTSVTEASSSATGGRPVILRVLSTPHVRKALMIGGGLSVFQQLCGINTVIYYSGTILKMAGFPVKHAIWLVVVPNVVNFLATFIGLWLVERLGRRLLLIISVFGVIVSLATLAIGFQLSYVYSPRLNYTATASTFTAISDANSTKHHVCFQPYRTCEECIHHKVCGFCQSDTKEATCLPAKDETDSLIGPCNSTSSGVSGYTWAYGYCPNDYTWISVVGMTMFVLAFAPGLGPMPWTVNSEIYPLWARSTCNSITTATVWICNFIVSMTFLTFTELITKHGTFWMFSGVSVLGLIFICIFLPETKGKTLEEVEELFMSEEDKVHHEERRRTKYTD
ncbi:proton myo-inositol cotransporter-like [Haliotis rufescens]|uniref:proton myo-inositol cotransporter-like n=1 Tax=Haliotis rufescens TaxID=6454 RepID=UPI00201F9A34|nr:proton myo-inositol cotransporter-like [Haliotis rufescens]